MLFQKQKENKINNKKLPPSWTAQWYAHIMYLSIFYEQNQTQWHY